MYVSKNKIYRQALSALVYWVWCQCVWQSVICESVVVCWLQTAWVSEAPGEAAHLYGVWQVVPLLPPAAYPHDAPRAPIHPSMPTLWSRLQAQFRPTSSSQAGSPRLTSWRIGEEWTWLPGVRLPCALSVFNFVCHLYLCVQRSHAAWKVMELKKGIFQAWKVMENDRGHGKLWKSHGIPPTGHGFFNRRIIILGV